MKKKFDIFGRKVPVLAVMMILLVIGTASAALILNYATLTGTLTVAETITVVDGDGTTILNEGEGVINFNETGEANFTINNDGDGTTVNLSTTLYNGEDPVPNTEGITIIYDVDTDGADPYTLVGLKDQLIPDQVIPIASGDNVVIVTFVADPALVAGVYTVNVSVNPYITT